MTSLTMNRLLVGASLWAGIAAVDVSAVEAQSFPASREDPSNALARHIRTLATSPRNLGALIAAGNAALQVGDTQAALTFFARAEEVAPRDGYVKAGMGSAFVQTEQPQAALKMFAEAVSLGVPSPMVAKDRGLAYDMVGQNQQAQADYSIALSRGPDAEVERRLALSRAISGDRVGALAVLEAQLRRQERAGWRARAFVLALTGDTAGALKGVQNSLGPQGAQMQPFLDRLPQLTPADKAMAVHFGRFPTSVRMAAVSAPAAVPPTPGPAPSQITAAGRPDPLQPSLGSSVAPQVAASSARPALGSAPVPATASPPGPAEKAEQEFRRSLRAVRDPRERRAMERAYAEAKAEAELRARQRRAALASAPQQSAALTTAPPPAVIAPVQTQRAEVVSMATVPAPAPQAALQESLSAGEPISAPESLADPGIPLSAVALPASQTPEPTEPVSSTAVESPSAMASTPAAGQDQADSIDFAEVAAAIAALPAAGDASPEQSSAAEAEKKPPAVAAKPSTKPPALKPAEPKSKAAVKAADAKATDPKAAAAKEPSRIWVQLAAAQNKSAFPGEFRRLKAKAPKLLADQSAWTAPLGATNRLLIGPFKTAKEAKDLVNELAKVQISSYSWTSEAGQAVTKIPAK